MHAALRYRKIETMKTIFPIQGQIQHYQWGGDSYLANLLNVDNVSKSPQAEYWLGAHPKAPSFTIPERKPLSEVCEEKGFNLPFLLKILDVRKMLSVQVHPTRAQAVAGYHAENTSGISIDDPTRNYKDGNHKPELMVALSEFWLLHGFRTTADIARILSEKTYLHPLREMLLTDGLRATFATLLDSQHPLVQTAHRQLLEDLGSCGALTDKHHPDFWAARWLKQNPEVIHGVLSLYFLNLIKLQPGEAIYQPAGLLHAYLEGQNVELMANSDNVLRAGLTPKHIDVAELLKIAQLSPSDPTNYFATPRRIHAHETAYITPFDEFELSQFHGDTEQTAEWRPTSAEILICVNGGASITAVDTEAKEHPGRPAIQLQQGDSLLILPGQQIQLKFDKKSTQLCRAKSLLLSRQSS